MTACLTLSQAMDQNTLHQCVSVFLLSGDPSSTHRRYNHAVTGWLNVVSVSYKKHSRKCGRLFLKEHGKKHEKRWRRRRKRGETRWGCSSFQWGIGRGFCSRGSSRRSSKKRASSASRLLITCRAAACPHSRRQTHGDQATPLDSQVPLRRADDEQEYMISNQEPLSRGILKDEIREILRSAG